jgi:hypothetical protein
LLSLSHLSVKPSQRFGTISKESPPRRSFPAMSCTPLTPAMRELLEACAEWPDVDVDQLQGPETEQARAWGWVMASGELTGTGWAHVKELPGGLVRD